VKITHHLDDATIIAHAAGTLGEAHSIVAAAHLAYCQVCRASVREAEAIGGGILAGQEAQAVSDICRSATLASLDAAFPKQATLPKPSRSGLPAVICNAIGNKTLEELPWKKKGPGISIFDVPLASGARGSLKLLSIGPGRAMPEHGHGGEEITLILKGSYSDHMGRFQAGDVADLDEEIEHTPVAGSEGVCICLVATEAPTKFKSFWARLAQPFVGI
jgi:putative transcriptional regulator